MFPKISALVIKFNSSGSMFSGPSSIKRICARVIMFSNSRTSASNSAGIFSPSLVKRRYSLILPIVAACKASCRNTVLFSPCKSESSKLDPRKKIYFSPAVSAYIPAAPLKVSTRVVPPATRLLGISALELTITYCTPFKNGASLLANAFSKNVPVFITCFIASSTVLKLL